MSARGRAAVIARFLAPDSPTAMPVVQVALRRKPERAGQPQRRRTGAKHRRERTGRDRGSAALEVALAVPIILLFLVSGVLLLGALAAKVSAADGAGAAARAAARGEPLPPLPASFDRTVTQDGDLVRVTVRRQVSNLIGADLRVEETAVAMVEPH
ncbi:TadE family type IV pilus minor pilin [Dactylosporangium sp. NPDC051541]|uniref:TadE family type IV pilus minor pilin n=1 Tax=Dactylosporangium sp. NPDC051541 TaxID=3363977 RepID=UPI0037A37287